jgi:hypothetical protein
MKKHLRRFLLTLQLTLAIAAVTSAQSVTFTYDASGNCVGRDITYPGLNLDVPDPRESANMTPDPRITVSPNPGDGKFRLQIEQYSSGQAGRLYVHNMFGVLVLEKEQLKADMILDLSDCQDGVYILSVLADRERSVLKLIKGT